MAAPFYVYDLLSSESLARWNGGAALGSPVTITYSFPTAQPGSTSYGNFTAFNATEIGAARAALDYISSLTNITFVEQASGGALSFGNADLTPYGNGVGGRATYSYNASGIQQATVVLSNTGQASLQNSDFEPGSITSNDIGGHGWSTLLHEIGHALGLKHPFDRNIANDPNSVMPTQYDDLAHTIMSYTPYQPSNVAIVTGTASSYSSSNLTPTGYSLYDIAALQYLYGVDYGTGGNTYTFHSDQPTYVTIADRGSNNTIDCSDLSGANRIDMRSGTFSDLSISQDLPFGITIANQYDGTSALSIVYGARVTTCIGGSGVDAITGNTLSNRIDGGAGADSMAGGAGNDTYYVDNVGDKVVEKGGQGEDKVISSITYSLYGLQVEKLSLTGTGNINGTGNSFDNTIGGNSHNNELNGFTGHDTLTGGAGYDRFVFANSITTANVDHITDFKHAVDKIVLDHTYFSKLAVGALGSTAFKDIASGSVDTTDRILYDHNSGELFYDADGSGSVSAHRFAILDNHPATLTASDFVIIA